MAQNTQFTQIISGVKEGRIVPYLGPGVVSDIVNKADGSPMPADSDSLILAMNNGKPMAPRLMYEFPRAAMNLELKKGRSFVERFLTTTYGETQWSEGKLHHWLANLLPKYIIDINRDTQLQAAYADIPHYLIIGCARIGGTNYRFKTYEYNGKSYEKIDMTEEAFSPKSIPVLFKPMGTPIPDPSYIAADADYVDYITELMGGFAIPGFLKDYRQQKQYLLLGMRLTRDTERMVLSEIIYGADSPHTGWIFIENPTEKERRFCKNKQLEIIEADWKALLFYESEEAPEAVALS